MCCRACVGHDMCQAKSALRDDCCTQCRYFDDCMEKGSQVEHAPHTNQPTRKYYRPKK